MRINNFIVLIISSIFSLIFDALGVYCGFKSEYILSFIYLSFSAVFLFIFYVASKRFIEDD